MREHTVCEPKPSTVVWENLDEFVRQQIQGVLQELLDEEVSAFLGRLKSQRRTLEATAGSAPAEDWERLLAYYDYPQAHWLHLRTSNPVESPLASARLRTSAAKRFKKSENATALLWKLLMVAESRFRKVHAPELMAKVAAGACYENGRPRRVGEIEKRIAALRGTRVASIS